MSASALAGARLSGAADVVVCESPPLFLAGAAIAYARLKRAPLLLNVADRWPASAVELGALSTGARSRPRSCSSASPTGAPRPSRCQPRASSTNSTRCRAHTGRSSTSVRPWTSTGSTPRPRARDGRLRVLYAGTVGMAQGLDTLVEAAARAGPEAVEVVVAGDGADAPLLRERVARERIDNVRMVGSVSHGDVPRLYAEADAAVVLLRDRPLFERALPTKMLEAMAAGRPVVLSARGEAARLVSDCGAGVVVPPEDPDALARAFADLATARDRAADLGAAGRRCAVERFSRERMVDRWWDVLDRLAGGHPLVSSSPSGSVRDSAA